MWLLLAALLSGCAILTYEVTWLRELILVVGSTFPALTVILAGFVGGLGVGAWLGGSLADAVRRPLYACAAVEAGMAVTALCFPVVAGLIGTLRGPFWSGTLGRALIACIALAPPAALMGASFPLFSKALHQRSGRHVPTLYGVHTLGAACGAVLGSMVLPYAIGVRETERVAALLNIIAAAIALWRGATGAEAADADATDTHAADADIPSAEPVPVSRALLLWLALGSGILASMGELFWTRTAILLQLRSPQLPAADSDAFALVLAVVLLGNAIGALLLGLVRTSVVTVLADVYSALAVACLLCLDGLSARLSLGLMGWPALADAAALAPLALALIPGVFLGISFPLVAQLFSQAHGSHGRTLGGIWLVNAGGCVVGSLLIGPAAIHTVGTTGGVMLTAALSLGLALASLVAGRAAGAPTSGARAASPREGRSRWGWVLAVLVFAEIALFVPLRPGEWFRLHYGRDCVKASWESLDAVTLVVDRPDQRILISNGREVSNVDRHWGDFARPQLLVPEARDVLLVGYSTGKIATSLLQLPQLRSLVIVELDGGQREAASWFGTAAVLTDPRVTFVTDDALHYVTLTDHRFDLAVIAAWDPAASPTVYSVEFHERLRERLTDRGVVWMKYNETGPAADTMRAVYAHTWRANPDILASMKPLNGPQLVELTPAGRSQAPLRHLYPRRFQDVGQIRDAEMDLYVQDVVGFLEESQTDPSAQVHLRPEQVADIIALLPALRTAFLERGGEPGTATQTALCAIFDAPQKAAIDRVRRQRGCLPTDLSRPQIFERFERWLRRAAP